MLFLTPTVEGKQHDKALADESNYQLPKEHVKNNLHIFITEHRSNGICVFETKRVLRAISCDPVKSLTVMTVFSLVSGTRY